MTIPDRVTLGLNEHCARATAGPRSERRACLFIDVDGTLLDFVDRPEAVAADGALIGLLQALLEATDGAVALISGRPIQQLDAIFAPLQLPVAGVHGFERRSANGRIHRPTIQFVHLDQARERLSDVVRMHAGLHLEDKGCSLALHFRLAPAAAPYARRAMQAVLAPLRPDFELLSGDQVLEIKPASHTKATAIEAFLAEQPFLGRLPVYLGDDVTDLDGFEAVRRHGGMDIAVGGRVSARWSLAGPDAVREWLMSLLAPRPASGARLRFSNADLAIDVDTRTP